MLRFPLSFGIEASYSFESQDVSSLLLTSIFACFKMEDGAMSNRLAIRQYVLKPKIASCIFTCVTLPNHFTSLLQLVFQK